MRDLHKAKSPICEKIENYIKEIDLRCHTPGHQGGMLVSENLKGWPDDIWEWDLTEVDKLDNLAYPQGVIAESESLTAQIYDVDKTFFITQGSTTGLQAAILAMAKPGDKVLVARHCHVSVWNALILSGANPVWLRPEYDEWGLVKPFNVLALSEMLNLHPDVVAVVLQNPTYEGQAGDIIEAVKLVHSFNIPLIIDEAHGAHWHFSSDLPLSAVDAGADIVVQSAHKTLPVLTGGAWMHCQGSLVNNDTIKRCLRLLQSTSPSYLILASLDAGQAYLSSCAIQKYQDLFCLIKSFYQELPVFKYAVFKPLDIKSQDFTRVNVQFTSEMALDWVNIFKKYGIMFEKREGQNFLFLLTPSVTQDDLKRLIHAIEECDQLITENSTHADIRLMPSSLYSTLEQEIKTTKVFTPRDVFYKESEWVSIDQAKGRVAAIPLMFYPPGVPLVLPGEIINESLITYLEQAGYLDNFIGVKVSNGKKQVSVVVE